MRKIRIIIAAALMLVVSACTISITMSGASIPENLKTFSVEYIENRAPLINPNLSQDLTDGLKDKIQKDSRLVLSEGSADIEFSGNITTYNTQPMAMKADAESALTRLNVAVKIKCRNFKDPKKDWEQSFSAYQDYNSDYNLNDVEEELVKQIVEELAENIFNKAFADW